MTDRELLVAAAKAVGLWDAREQCIDIPWNPLNDDGDALRLAAKLRLRISISHEHDYTEVVWYSEFRLKRLSGGVVEQWGDDRDAATRRAIVRAAAALITPGDAALRRMHEIDVGMGEEP